MDDTENVFGETEFVSSFGESIENALNIDTWATAYDLAELYAKLTKEVERAVKFEAASRSEIREQVFPKLRTRPGAPPEAGVYRATLADIEHVHKHVLFNGGVEACDGNSLIDDRLPLTITQIGVSLVAYQGNQNTWVHQLFRRDLRQRGGDPVEEAIQLLEKRSLRGGVGLAEKEDQLSTLAQRGIMAYAERAILLNKSTRPWRMGHGNPAPYEILTGSGDMRLLDAGLAVLQRLLLEHKRFVFVPSSTSIQGRLMPTLGNALRPLEYAIVESTHDSMYSIVANGHYSKEYRQKALNFVERAGEQILIGIYRVSELSPANIFFGHREHIHEAALIALADSVLMAHRGFPMLIDIADNKCRSMMGMDGFAPTVETAYVDAGAPFSYLTERASRGK